MQNFPRASEERSGSSDSRRASAEFVLRQPHGRITAAGWRTVRSADTRLFPCHGRIRKSVPDPPTPVVHRRVLQQPIRTVWAVVWQNIRSAEARHSPCCGRVQDRVLDPPTMRSDARVVVYP
ncbi:hypothetical protein TNCT_508331 [Trichonephila clavata]|uniref:Uncharacterized protein n=1 Tax=Trichonephila clavata TaxID=2740835 RepID=A0A8X6KUT4_TRICU|nr:hypothetical protein TNCT_508331 [Trichonephila clavata]